MGPDPFDTWGRAIHKQKRGRSAISDGICAYTKKRDKKRKDQRARTKAGRRANRG